MTPGEKEPDGQYWPHFLMFFTTHSIPSLTPSPDVALHAWICHTRSWKRNSDGGNLVVKIFLMSFGIRVFNKNWGEGGERVFEVPL